MTRRELLATAALPALAGCKAVLPKNRGEFHLGWSYPKDGAQRSVLWHMIDPKPPYEKGPKALAEWFKKRVDVAASVDSYEKENVHVVSVRPWWARHETYDEVVRVLSERYKKRGITVCFYDREDNPLHWHVDNS